MTTVARVITLNSNDEVHLITHSTVTDPSRIVVQLAGGYLVTTSLQLGSTSGSGTVDIWLRLNGSDLAGSNSRSFLTAASDLRILTVTFVLTLAANDYIEFVEASSNVNAGVTAFGAATLPTRPATPSIIVTINKVSD